MTLVLQKEQKENMRHGHELSETERLTGAGVFRGRTRGNICLAPGLTLARGRVHEIMGDSADVFALLAAGACDGLVVWAGGARDIDSLAPTGM